MAGAAGMRVLQTAWSEDETGRKAGERFYGALVRGLDILKRAAI